MNVKLVKYLDMKRFIEKGLQPFPCSMFELPNNFIEALDILDEVFGATTQEERKFFK